MTLESVSVTFHLCCHYIKEHHHRFVCPRDCEVVASWSRRASTRRVGIPVPGARVLGISKCNFAKLLASATNNKTITMIKHSAMQVVEEKTHDTIVIRFCHMSIFCLSLPLWNKKLSWCWQTRATRSEISQSLNMVPFDRVLVCCSNFFRK